MNITTIPAWKFTTDLHGEIDPILFVLLANLQTDKRLTTAAAKANISYRHAWNVIKKWNKHFGQPLVQQNKGRGTQLTVLGEKLLWAEQLIDAHLSPQIDTLSSTINRGLNEVMGKHDNILTIHASHGYAVGILPRMIAENDHLSVDIKYMGSVAAVKSLVEGDCQMAGFHLCEHPLLKSKVSQAYQPYLNNADYVIIQMVLRHQGLIVRKDNPKNIHFLSDLVDPTLQFINRQPASGTRLLIDELLQLCQLNAKNITGYNNEEFTHTAVAAHVASGAADVGFGIAYAADKFNLDFIPVVKEKYVLACRKQLLKSNNIKQVLRLLENYQFSEYVHDLVGYQPDSPGKCVDTADFLEST
jgi:molybdate transport repressor ModE-like protein